MNLVVVFFGIFGLVWSAYGESTAVSQCTRYGGSNPAAVLPINTYIQGCTTPPCLLPLGTDAVINIVMRAPHNIHSMTSLASAFLGIIPIPYPLGNEAVTCNFLQNTYCPLVKDEVVQYILRMPVEEWMGEGTSVPIEFYIRDNADNSVVACLRTTILLVAPLHGKSVTNN